MMYLRIGFAAMWLFLSGMVHLAVAQKNCTIYYFDALQEEDLSRLKMYAHVLECSGRYDVVVENFYDRSIQARVEPLNGKDRKRKFWNRLEFSAVNGDADWSTVQPTNDVHNAAYPEEKRISEELYGDVHWLREAEWSAWPGRFDRKHIQLGYGGAKGYSGSAAKEFISDFDGSDNIIVIYPNAPVPHRSSCEKLQEAMANMSEEELTVSMDESLFRVRGRDYKVPFDSIGIYESYEIEIGSLREGYVCGGEPLLKQEVQFGKESFPECYLERGRIGSRCFLVIDEVWLANLCLQARARCGDKTQYVEDGVTGCQECEAECLYKSVFFIRFRGFPSGECAGPWSKRFEARFQCNK